MPKSPLVSKVCPDCKIDKPRSDYYKKGDTISYRCKPCSLADSKKRAPKYFNKYSDYVNQWKREKYQREPDYREKIAAQKKAAYDARIENINAHRRDRWATDPNNPARKYYRRKDVKDRTPRWVDLREIAAFSVKCPAGHEVDHIVPLKGLIDGRPVTGLHVLWNLQYLPVADNRKKQNRISEETLSSLR